MDKIARLFAEISADNTKFKSTMNSTNSMLKNTAGRFSSFTTGIIQGFGQAFGQATIRGIREVGSALGSVVGGAANTEQQVADIQSILQATAEEGQLIKDLLNDLAVDPKLKVSLSDAGALTEMLARNGVEAKDIIDGMAKSTILLSNATKGDFAQSADVLTDVMALWKDMGLTAEEAINSITSVTNKSKLNLNEYQYAFANIAGAASNLKIPFEDVNAALIATASYFKSGRVQGSSFNTFLTRLVPTTKPALAAFDELGLRINGVNQLFDETGSLKDFSQIAKLLQNSIQGLSDEEAIELLSAAFGTTATDFLLGIAKTGAEGLEAIKKEAAEVSAEANAAVVTDTTLSKWETFKDTLEGIGNLIGDKFLPDLKRLIEGLLDLVTLNKKDFVGAFDGLKDSFKGFVDFLLGNQTSIQKGFNNFISGLTSAINNIPTFINWIVYAKNTLSEFANNVTQIATPIVKAFSDIFQVITRGMPNFNFKALFDTIADFGLNDSAMTQLHHLGMVIIQSIRTGFNNALEAYLKPAFNKFVEWLKSPETHQKAMQAIQNTWTFFNEWAENVWNYVAPKLQVMWNNLMSWVTDSEKRNQLIDGLKQNWNSFKEWADNLWKEHLYPGLQRMWNNLISWITSSERRQQLVEGLVSIWNGFKEWANSLWVEHIYPGLSNAWVKTNEFIQNYAPSFGSWLDSIKDFTKGAHERFKETFPQMGLSIDKLSATVGEEIPKIAEAFNNLWKAIFGDGGNAHSQGGSFASAITKIFSTITESLGGLIKYLRNTIDLLTVFVKATKAAFSGDFEQFLNLRTEFNSLIGEYGDIFNQQRDNISNIWANQVDGEIVVRIEDAQNLPQNRAQLEELARLLQQQMGLNGVRVTP